MDWETKRIKGRVPISARDPDLNDLFPGSSTRGGRGIQVLDDKVVVASYHTLKVFDRELVHQYDISNGLMVGLHETCMDGSDNVWASCTNIDAVIQVNLNNGNILNQYWPAEMPEFQKYFDISPMNVDRSVDNRLLFMDISRYKQNRLHLNALATWQGEMYGLLAKLGSVVNLDARKVVFEDPALRGGHNLIIQEDGTAVVNDTYGRAIRAYDMKTGSINRIIRLNNSARVRKIVRRYLFWELFSRALYKTKMISRTPPRALFLRGMSLMDNLLFVGVSPATILCIDWHNGNLLDMYSYSKEIRVCVHGLKAVNGKY